MEDKEERNIWYNIKWKMWYEQHLKGNIQAVLREAKIRKRKQKKKKKGKTLTVLKAQKLS